MRSCVLTACLVLMLTILGGCTYNYHAVIPGQVYRSAQPFEEDLRAWVRRDGIKTVLRLRGGVEGAFWYDQSDHGARAQGARVHQVAMSAKRFPTREQLIAVIDAIESEERPMLIHCQQGSDRTGLVSAIVVLMEGGSLERARRELDFIPYLHINGFETARMDETLDMYEPWHGTLSFENWVREVYQTPPFEELPTEFQAMEARRVVYYMANGELPG